MAKQNNENQGSKSPTKNIKAIKQGPSQIQYTRFSDWVLVVEGATDKDFYKNGNYTSLIVEKLETVKSNSRKKLFDKLEEIKKQSSREKIITIIKEKLDDGKHFYGIMDADYINPNFKVLCSKLKYDYDSLSTLFIDNLKMTDANSLETMMIKYSGTKEFANILKNIKPMPKLNHPDFSLVTEQDICDALELAFYVGLLRQYNEKGGGKSRKLDFSDTVKNTNFYYAFLTQPFSKSSFKQQYIMQLKNNSPDSKENINTLQNILNNQYSQDKAWDLCQGHDVIDCIEAILLNRESTLNPNSRNSINCYLRTRNICCRTNYVPTQNEHNIIDDYNKSTLKFFYGSNIYSWLQKIENEKSSFLLDVQKQLNSIVRRPLENSYDTVYVISLSYHIKSKNKPNTFIAYIFFDITSDGFKEVLDIKTIEAGKLKYNNLLLWGAELRERGLSSIKDVFIDKSISDSKNIFEKLFSVVFTESIIHKVDISQISQNPKSIFNQIYRPYSKTVYNDEDDFWQTIFKTLSGLKTCKNWII